MKNKKYYLIAAIILSLFAGAATLYFVSKPSPKDDRYYTDKYRDIRDHDACVAEYNKNNAGKYRLTGLPCPGEPQ